LLYWRKNKMRGRSDWKARKKTKQQLDDLMLKEYAGN
jgi:hypothetical protein